MDTDEQRIIRETAREFATERLLPGARARERNGRIEHDVIEELGALGFLGMTVPEEYGGSGADYVSYAVALMELAAGDGAVSTLVSVHNAPFCAVLWHHGTAEQKQEWLVPAARGEYIGAFALTEPQAGSDASAIQSTAVRRNDGYILNGNKQFITSGLIAGATLVFAQTDPQAGKKGMSCFFVEKNTPGFASARPEEKLGQRASDTTGMIFHDVVVPRKNLIGEEGAGYSIALSSLETGRIGIAAQAVGMASHAFEIASTYAGERVAFGKPIAQHQAVQFRLADMGTQIEAARHLVLHAAGLKDRGVPCLKEACMAKLFASEMAERVCSDAIQVLGGYGYLAEYDVEKIYRDVRVCQIYEGTSDIQRMIIAREQEKGRK